MAIRLWLILLLILPGVLPRTAGMSNRTGGAAGQTGCSAAGVCCCDPTDCPCVAEEHEPSTDPIEPALPVPNGRDHFTAIGGMTVIAQTADPARSASAWCGVFYRQRHLPIRSLHIQFCLWTT